MTSVLVQQQKRAALVLDDIDSNMKSITGSTIPNIGVYYRPLDFLLGVDDKLASTNQSLYTNLIDRISTNTMFSAGSTVTNVPKDPLGVTSSITDINNATSSGIIVDVQYDETTHGFAPKTVKTQADEDKKVSSPTKTLNTVKNELSDLMTYRDQVITAYSHPSVLNSTDLIKFMTVNELHNVNTMVSEWLTQNSGMSPQLAALCGATLQTYVNFLIVLPQMISETIASTSNAELGALDSKNNNPIVNMISPEYEQLYKIFAYNTFATQSTVNNDSQIRSLIYQHLSLYNMLKTGRISASVLDDIRYNRMPNTFKDGSLLMSIHESMFKEALYYHLKATPIEDPTIAGPFVADKLNNESGDIRFAECMKQLSFISVLSLVKNGFYSWTQLRNDTILSNVITCIIAMRDTVLIRTYKTIGEVDTIGSNGIVNIQDFNDNLLHTYYPTLAGSTAVITPGAEKVITNQTADKTAASASSQNAAGVKQEKLPDKTIVSTSTTPSKYLQVDATTLRNAAVKLRMRDMFNSISNKYMTGI